MLMAGVRNILPVILLAAVQVAEAKVDSLNELINEAEIEQSSSSVDIQVMLEIDPHFINLKYSDIADIEVLEKEVSIALKKLPQAKSAKMADKKIKKSRSIASVSEAD